jgi:hypothetical protein
MIVVTMSTFDSEMIQAGLYILIKIPHPNYRQNFSRAKVYLLLIKVFHEYHYCCKRFVFLIDIKSVISVCHNAIK